MTTVASRPSGALVQMAADIKLAHSVFALPFAIFGAFLAGFGGSTTIAWSRFGQILALIIVCMVLARTWAMLVNRLLDRSIDAKNPRTARRVFAAGSVSAFKGWAIAIACAAGFVLVCAAFQYFFHNRWPLILSVPVLAWLAFYSLTKRFTALCHLVLGVALALSPIAAAIAVRPASLGTTPALWWTAAFVTMWVAGFDIIYALQDETFDRGAGLSSIPASVGAKPAAWISRALHLFAIAALLACWTSNRHLGNLFGGAIIAVIALLSIEHAVLASSFRRASNRRPGLHVAFFTLNGVVSCLVGAAGCMDLCL
ncbi:MAG: 4-hydroxybenzoate octaprenyltransferase [Phycisphaerales bacterium]|jgi:4-hydroxybenzoate polyprenyltransferase